MLGLYHARSGLLVLIVAAAPLSASAQRLDCGNPTIDSAHASDYRTATRMHLAVVERRHFTADVRALRRGESTSEIGGDIAYTLRKFPNHYQALLAMGDWSIKTARNPPAAAGYSVECWFERARVFAPDDAMVKVAFGIYLLKRGKPREAVAQLEAARGDDESNANVHYNLGLAYVETKDFDKAIESAHRAYELGFPLPGLKDRLERAGKWRDPATPKLSESADVQADGR